MLSARSCTHPTFTSPRVSASHLVPVFPFFPLPGLLALLRPCLWPLLCALGGRLVERPTLDQYLLSPALSLSRLEATLPQRNRRRRLHVRVHTVGKRGDRVLKVRTYSEVPPKCEERQEEGRTSGSWGEFTLASRFECPQRGSLLEVMVHTGAERVSFACSRNYVLWKRAAALCEPRGSRAPIADGRCAVKDIQTPV